MTEELEIKIKELETQPGHILGLDGWILRTVPKEKRKTFLEGYEKLLRIAYFPDHAKTTAERAQREKYIQLVSQAVELIKSNPFAYEIATEDVPARVNPNMGQRRLILEKEEQIQKLTAELIQKNNEIRTEKETASVQTNMAIKAMQEQYDQLKKMGKGREFGTQKLKNELYSEKRKQKLLLDKIEGLFKAREYQDGQIRSGDGALVTAETLVLRGSKPRFRTLIQDEEIKAVSLLDIAFSAYSSPKGQVKFSRLVEKHLVRDKDRVMVFKRGVKEEAGNEATLLGGLSYVALVELLNYRSLLPEAVKDFCEDNLDFRIRSKILPFFVTSGKRKEYERSIMPFISPFLFPPELVLIRSAYDKYKTHYNLFYVREAKAYPKGVKPILRPGH